MQKIIVTFIFLIIISSSLFVVSKNADPTTSLYYVKRMKENIYLLTKTAPLDKAEYYSYLLDVRLDELKNLTRHKKIHHLILPAALRYSTTAGEYTHVIKQYNLKEYSKKAKKEFAEDTLVLKNLILTYPRLNVGDRGDTFIVDAVNYLKIYEKELPH